MAISSHLAPLGAPFQCTRVCTPAWGCLLALTAKQGGEPQPLVHGFLCPCSCSSQVQTKPNQKAQAIHFTKGTRSLPPWVKVAQRPYLPRSLSLPVSQGSLPACLLTCLLACLLACIHTYPAYIPTYPAVLQQYTYSLSSSPTFCLCIAPGWV